MRRAGRGRLAVAAVAMVAAVGAGLGHGPRARAGRAGVAGGTAAAPAAIAGATLGSGSCSGSSCHGSVRRVADLRPQPAGWTPVWRNEHTLWIANDPHARAYAVLLEPKSAEIVRNLAAGRGPVEPAQEDERCLACHSTPRAPAELAATAWQSEDGVGCESCHGPASRWIGDHAQVGFRGLPAEVKEGRYGLYATKDLGRRAEICAGCHVGRRDPATGIIRDMNHDMIAAGHPRLTFEFTAALANEPRHWSEQGPNRGVDFLARAWAVGQVATAKVAAELLHRRAADEASAPWPEFSEYDCYACHHSLVDQKWRQQPDGAKARLGQPEWASWFGALLPELAADATLGDRAASSAYEEARGAVGGPWDVREESRREAARRAAELSGALDGWARRLDATPLEPATIDRLMGELRSADGWARVHNWDGAAQRYLALVPLRQALLLVQPPRDDPALRDELARLLEDLRFPPGSDSPRRELDPTTLGR